MNNLVKKSMLVVVAAASLSSCARYYHSYRNVDVAQTSPVNAKMQVDVAVTPDFSKRLRAQSTKNHWRNKQSSMDEAYFNAIIENQIDVLISPIYSVTERGGFFDATIHGYAGYYKTIDKSDAVSDFDKKVEDLKKLSKVDGVLSSEEQKVYKINSTCGDCKSSEALSLLTVTTNKSSLVDIYEKVLNIGSGNKSNSASTKSIFVTNNNQKKSFWVIITKIFKSKK
jgi:hypothetical protein